MDTEQKIRDAATVSEIIQLAGLNADALKSLEATTDNQCDFAAWVRVEALAGIWEARIKGDAKNKKMAMAIVNAANKHSSAGWWLVRKSHAITRGGFMDDLKQDIKQEMSK